MEDVYLGKKLDYSQVPSPCFVLDEARLRKNMEILDDIQKRGHVNHLRLKRVQFLAQLSAYPKLPRRSHRL